ncbi:MAG: FmdB family zinc ribbon protein [Dissulfurimicrobium sp.]|uniref:FmdB family zinc ribbon protein n=1 Tax=Dissulfurimicrobium TaxID=1769732 RepID=UPI0038B4127D|nr:zinc ribbon domain-containing protein [Dissulfurimicrobium hydrothermale]
MPIHEFRCRSCNSDFELLLISKVEIVDVRCPMCQSPDVQKVLSAANISVADGGNKKTNMSRSMATSKASTGCTIQERSCGSGSCATFELSGHNREK